MTTTQYIKENNKRLKELLCEYDPVSGIGSKVPRFKYHIFKSKEIYLPSTMLELDYLEDGGVMEDRPDFDIVFKLFLKDRMDHDFEYWAFKTVKIKPKEGGDDIPFKLNRPQRRYLAKLEELRVQNVPIRVILLKARQWGGSTLTQIYMAWIQLRHKTNWNSLIGAHLNRSAQNIRGMYNKMAESYPLEKISLDPYENTTNVKIIKSRKNRISIGSMESPDSMRGEDVSMVHLSEVGLWKKTEGKTPEDMIQSIIGSVPKAPYSIVVQESTAKGVGNYFHTTWGLACRKGEPEWNRYEPFFVPWFEIEMYRTEFESEDEKLELIKSLDDYELFLWNEGACLEQIKWYRDTLASFNGDRWRMCSEFPTTAREAFQSTGRRVFKAEYIQKMRATCVPPKFTGELYGNSHFGPEALKGLAFEASNAGGLKIWSMPDETYGDNLSDMNVYNRYCVILDVGGVNKKADYTSITVIDRYFMAYGGMAQRAASWHGRMEADMAAWKAAQIAKWYDDALLVIEVNSRLLGRNYEQEGDTYYTVIDEIRPHYSNLFSRTPPEQIRIGYPAKYGWHMNSQTKPEIKDSFIKSLRENLYLEFDSLACDEADTFEYKDKPAGAMGAVEGNHDDHIDTTMIGNHVCLYLMSPVKILEREKTTYSRPVRKGNAEF